MSPDTTLAPVAGHPVSGPPDRCSDQVALSGASKEEAGARHQGPAACGQLRIYLSFATGAGTTCALLSEGHRLTEHGTDVVVASAHTHGRPYTAGLLQGLEVIPPAKVRYQETMVEEMNLGAVLARGCPGG